jgi:hypothetical protein
MNWIGITILTIMGIFVLNEIIKLLMNNNE